MHGVYPVHERGKPLSLFSLCPVAATQRNPLLMRLVISIFYRNYCQKQVSILAKMSQHLRLRLQALGHYMKQGLLVLADRQILDKFRNNAMIESVKPLTTE